MIIKAKNRERNKSNAKAAAGAARRQARATRCCGRKARAEGSSHEHDRKGVRSPRLCGLRYFPQVSKARKTI